ncbi:MAG: aspartyl protease family protein, partial [Gemmataceae bacterium]|nr:aspartyl protease family protein [Gemmataceae bacterium]
AVPLAVAGPRVRLLQADGAVGPEKVKFLVDSGAGETLLDAAVARRLKLELGKESTQVGLAGRWVGREAIAPGLLIGPYDTRFDWTGFAVVAGDLSGWLSRPGGVLGTDVLGPWAGVVDYPARTLYLRPPLVAGWPRMAGTWAVTSWREDGKDRKLDPQAPPTFAFADRRLKLTEGDKNFELAVQFGPNEDGDWLLLYDPKEEGKPNPEIVAGGRVRIDGDRMTACLLLGGDNDQLPTEFAAPKGSGHALLELKRTAPAADRKPPADPLRDLLVKDGYTAVPLERVPGGGRVAVARAGQHDLRLLVDTGATVSLFDTAGLTQWGATRRDGVALWALGSLAQSAEIGLPGLKLGGYDTRRAWAEVYGAATDLAGVNKALADKKGKQVHGVLGNLDLLTGSAVVDFGTNTLYLRPAKDTLWPKLEGKWVGTAWEQDGAKGRYDAGASAVEFTDGRVRYTANGKTAEWGFHLRDEGGHYRVGLFDPGADVLADGFRYASGGLLKVDGDKLTLLMVRDKAKVKGEPSEFKAPAGSGLLVVEYERAK